MAYWQPASQTKEYSGTMGNLHHSQRSWDKISQHELSDRLRPMLS